MLFEMVFDGFQERLEAFGEFGGFFKVWVMVFVHGFMILGVFGGFPENGLNM